MNNYEKNINKLNLEITKLCKRISVLENINRVKNNDEYFYNINDFGIPYIDQILLNKNYYYLKYYSNIFIRFECDFIRKENDYDDEIFRVNILDNNYKILYSKDKAINFNDHIKFEMNLNIDKDIINPTIEIIIIGNYNNSMYINYGEMFIDGYFFKNCKLYKF